MNYGALFFACSIILLQWDVACSGFIENLLFPRMPTVTKYRKIKDACALGDEFAVLDTVGLVEQYGYSIDEHRVTTADGYSIIFFRIYGSPVSPGTEGKPVIFLQHGIYSSSDSWVLFGPGKDLAFLLADEGYDVWIGNIRGNSYGRSHIYLSPQDPMFWKFSFHEVATRDLSTMIEHVLQYTGQKTLSYVGHSMGTTIAYILLSEMPDYNDKIRLAVCLAPVALWKYAPTVISRRAAQRYLMIRRKLDKNGIYDAVPQTTNNARVSRALCNDHSLTQATCLKLLFKLVGDDPEQLNSTLLPYIFSYYPAGGSTATLYHYQQNVISGMFQQFDLGSIENVRRYRKTKPPIYDLKKITAPIALIYGKKDVISIEPNIAELSRILRNVVTFEAVPHESFNHIDFQWGKDANKLLYDRIIELVARYSR